MCGKIGFASQAEAKRFARQSSRQSKVPGRLYPYRCACGDWHLTHYSPQEQRRRYGRAA